ncbi:hypothetical protein D9M71_633200 [compost metagenome]
MIVGRDGGVQRRQSGIGVEQRSAAEDHLFVALVPGQEHRAAHRRQRAVPAQQLAVQQVLALLDGRARTVLLGDVGEGGEELVEVVLVVHCQFLWSGWIRGKLSAVLACGGD